MTRFTLYSVDIRELVAHVTTKINDIGMPDDEGKRRRYEKAHFDVDEDGNVHVHVDEKGTITL